MAESIILPDNPEHCPTCNVAFTGSCCYACGERQPSRKDYTVKKYALQAVDMFTHFDGKFFTTIKYLLFYPGKLTTENLTGRKVKLMKPVQLFLVVSLVYFFLMKEADVFMEYLKYSDKNGLIYKAAQQKAKTKNISIEEFVNQYDKALPDVSKTYVFVLVPAIALGVWALFFRRIKTFVPHLIFATHFFAFFLLFTLLYFKLILLWLNPSMFTPGQRLTMFGIACMVILVYLFFAINRVYRQRIWITVGKTTLMMMWFFLSLVAYRQAVSLLYLHFSA